MRSGGDHAERLYPRETHPARIARRREDRKPWWRSKTLWFNAIVAALAALEYAGVYLRGLVPGDIFGWGMAVLAVGNAVLRVLTFQPVGWRGRPHWPGSGAERGQWGEQWED